MHKMCAELCESYRFWGRNLVAFEPSAGNYWHARPLLVCADAVLEVLACTAM
jgi:hypothetical protein